MADESRPYIGYRSAGRRPESQQDRRAAADAPLSALRGMVSGVLGAPGDIESLIRMIPGLQRETKLSDLVAEQAPSATWLPTSEEVEKRLPMRELNQTPTGRAFTTAGQIGGGFYTGPGSPLRLIAGLPSAVSRAGRDFLLSTSPVHVVKPKGGNWLAGSVERAIEPLRSGTIAGRTPAQRIPEHEALLLDPALNADQLDRVRHQLGVTRQEASVDKWLGQKLAKYIEKEMATPEDPLRALAERGVTHAEIQPTGYNVARARREAGFPEEGMATSPMAKTWEDRTDTFINQLRASDLTGHYPEAVEANPWLLKVPPETRVHELLSGADRDLGFSHLTDELRNAVNPESGLPANLRLKYQDLEKVTVPQAVQRVADINAWRAANKAEADMARAMGPATHVFKEYPEQGFKWVELKAPKETGRKISVEKPEMDLPPDFNERMGREVAEDMAYDEGLEEGTREFNDFVRDRMIDFSRKKTVEMDEAYKALEDALKYEGETMGHCVGGYCPDVIEGRSKIFSLRDKKGQPHVTIETRPMENYELEAAKMKRAGASPEEIAAFFENPPQEIVQIKGKANRAPNAEYLPAVQDFVRSGNFGKIGDLKNAGLVQLPDKRLITNEQFDEAISRISDGGDRPTNEWFMNVMRGDPSWWEEMKGAFEGFSRGGQVRGYADGGQVSGANFPTDDFDPDRIDAIVGELHAMNAA